MQFKGKAMIQTQQNDKKLYLGPDLGPLNLKLDPYFFLLKNPISSITRYHVHLSSCTIPDNHPILRKFTDGRTDGQTERRTRVI